VIKVLESVLPVESENDAIRVGDWEEQVPFVDEEHTFSTTVAPIPATDNPVAPTPPLIGKSRCHLVVEATKTQLVNSKETTPF
jgi:hypothetical protein